MKRYKKSIFALFLAGLLLLTGCGGGSKRESGDSQSALKPGNSESGAVNSGSGATQPGGTENGSTQPSGAENGSTQPGGAENGSAQPGGAENGSTQSGGTENGSTQPGGAENGSTQPGGAENGSAQPGSSETGTTKPGNSESETTKPGNSETGTTKPGNSESGTTKPGNSESGMTKPGNSESGTTQPGNSESGTTQPGNSESGSTQPQPGNIMKNPYFTDGTSSWTAGNGASTISTAKADKPIVGEIATYGVIERDPSTSQPYDCFAQDITDVIENGVEYEFEFYAMLSDEYKNAPEDQRKVEFAPYYTLNGETSYLGTYSDEIKGTSSQALKPGVWTRYSGTFMLNCAKKPEKIVVRIIEQGTDWGSGTCVKGDYYLTGFSLRKKAIPEIEKDIPGLKDVVASSAGLGNGAIVGCAVSGALTDQAMNELVKKHFNAVTIGNELKPDCHFFYSNDRCPGTQEYDLNGEKVMMPKLNFAYAEKILDIILKWNNENPSSKIRVRGHVLVWHSQTPEWFFHKDFDASKAYVSKEEMDVRQEWYIKSILEHYVGANSKYKDLFYGWDVVNEAVSDGTGTYRNASEGSSWWAVYKSEEYIINAFKYANKYAPASVELYYNDYNDCLGGKVKGIEKLLKAVKEKEGAQGVGTRIDAMGMQAHYWEGHPSQSDLENAVRTYCKVVGKVQMTEWDLKASDSYDGSEAAKSKEYVRMAKQYQMQYETLKKLNAESGVTVAGITFWGTVDKYSWLHTASHVGGGADGKSKQCPLLFDDDYQAKPSFWAFVDPSKIK